MPWRPASLPGFVYNITGGSYETEADLARMMTEYLPTLSIAHGPAAWNEGHLGPLVIEAAERDLGYRPQIPLRQGLAELFRHLARTAT